MSVLSAEKLGKRYFTGASSHHKTGVGDLLREILRLSPRVKSHKDEFWAVRGVDLSIGPGEGVGVIGLNGSGKTTLMKLLAGILTPDAGHVVASGSIQAMISLGAGFNPRLTGRENILNATALRGLNPKEARGRIDEIVAFADIEKFIDSPVETYSSGMAARLGFSLCVHTNPAIIVIDEALSVGDQSFRNKCLVKLEELKRSGTAMVLVSHSMTQVIQFCERAVWLDEGTVRAQGPVRQVTDAYIDHVESIQVGQSEAPKMRSGAAGAVGRGEPSNLPRVELPAQAGEGIFGMILPPTNKITDICARIHGTGPDRLAIAAEDSLSLEYQFALREWVDGLNVSLNICREDGQLMTTISTLNGDLLADRHEGVVSGRVNIRCTHLAPGRYTVVMPIHEGQSYLFRGIIGSFSVTSNGKMYWGLMHMPYSYEVADVEPQPVGCQTDPVDES